MILEDLKLLKQMVQTLNERECDAFVTVTLRLSDLRQLTKGIRSK